MKYFKQQIKKAHDIVSKDDFELQEEFKPSKKEFQDFTNSTIEDYGY